MALHDMEQGELTREWVGRARRLRPLLAAAPPRIEQARTLPPDVLDAMHAAQIFRMTVPRSLGGAELPPGVYAQVVATIAEGDASAAWCIAQSACAMMAAAYVEPRVAQEVFGDARAVFTFGFTAGEPPCLAVPVKDGWIINGTWTFASGNRLCAWLGGHCRLSDETGAPLKNPDGRFIERTMIFPRSLAIVDEDMWNVMGLCGTGSDTYTVKDLFVPTAYSVVPRVSARDQQLPDGVLATQPEPERRFRDMHVVAQQVQGSVARMHSVGQHYLGLAPKLILIP